MLAVQDRDTDLQSVREGGCWSGLDNYPGVTILYLKWDLNSHLNFEIVKIGVICVPKDKFFGVFQGKNGVNIFGPIQESHPCSSCNWLPF